MQPISHRLLSKPKAEVLELIVTLRIIIIIFKSIFFKQSQGEFSKDASEVGVGF